MRSCGCRPASHPLPCSLTPGLQVVHFIRHGEGFHNVAGHANPEEYKWGRRGGCYHAAWSAVALMEARSLGCKDAVAGALPAGMAAVGGHRHSFV